MVTINYKKSFTGEITLDVEIPDAKLETTLDRVERIAHALNGASLPPLSTPVSERLGHAAADLLDAIVRDAKRG